MSTRTWRTAVGVPAVLGLGLALGSCAPGAVPARVAACGAEDRPVAAQRAEDADVRFLTAMVPHHEAGVAMASVAARRASGPDVRALAREIAAQQTREVAQMRSWLRERGVAVPRAWGMRGMPHGPVGAGHPGHRIDRMFLIMMIEHHRDAIALARAELERGEDEDVVALAHRIVVGQSAQVRVMEGMLAGG